MREEYSCYLSEQFDMLQLSFAAAEKISAILDMEPGVVDRPDAMEVRKILKKVKLFRRKGSLYSEERVLGTLFLSAAAGESFLQDGERIYATLIQNYFTIFAVNRYAAGY